MLKTLQFDQSLHNGCLVPLPQSSSIQAQRALILDLEQETLNEHFVKKRNATTWRLYFSEVKGHQSRLAKQSKVLQKLRLVCTCKASDKALYHPIQYFKGFKALRVLSLQILPWSRITKTGLCHLNEDLKRLSSLSSLELNFDKCEDFHDKSLEILSRGLRRQISLRSIKLSFARCEKITSLGVQSLCQGLKNLVFLRSVSLSFSECDLVTDEGLAYLGKCLRRIKILQRVELDFKRCTKISLDGLEQIFQAFTILPSLKYTVIHICGYLFIISIKENECEQGFKNAAFYQKIGLDFWRFNTNILFNCHREFVKTRVMTPQNNLEYVFETHSSELIHLCLDLRTLVLLQNLTLTFFYCCKMTDQKLKILAKSLKGLALMKKMTLNFYNCTQITDRGLQNLSKGFEALRYLEDMHINFSLCHQITDVGLEWVFLDFEGLNALKNLSFIFSGSSHVSDSGIKKAAQSLGRVMNLQEVSLKFGKVPEVTNGGRERFGEILESHSSLKKAAVDFGHGIGNLEILDDRVD